jgi:hypothetical protein
MESLDINTNLPFYVEHAYFFEKIKDIIKIDFDAKTAEVEFPDGQRMVVALFRIVQLQVHHVCKNQYE